jgi:hypothetical protein
MGMIKRSIKQNAMAGVVKEKIKTDSNDEYSFHYCCHICRSCFSTLEEMNQHECNKKD